MPNASFDTPSFLSMANDRSSGGGFEMNKNGESIQTKDHDFNHSSVRCFLGSLKAKKPLDIVVGMKTSSSLQVLSSSKLTS